MLWLLSSAREARLRLTHGIRPTNASFMNQPRINQKASTSVSAFLSLLLPGTGQYYAGRSLKEALGWYGLSYLVTLILNLAVQGSESRSVVLAGLLIIAFHLVAMIHAMQVAQKTREHQHDSRRLPALSVVLPGLGQIKAGRYLRGAAWLVGFALLSSLIIILGSKGSDTRGAWAIFFASLGIYNLLSGYDMHRVTSNLDAVRSNTKATSRTIQDP